MSESSDVIIADIKIDCNGKLCRGEILHNHVEHGKPTQFENVSGVCTGSQRGS